MLHGSDGMVTWMIGEREVEDSVVYSWVLDRSSELMLALLGIVGEA